tara:strand:+ start:9117 stop:9362 length:246 start_codon:yes stop_codon:yes gene_type:complete
MNVTEKSFRSKLAQLLSVYDASIEAEDHYPDYPECGKDIRMTVSIPTVYTGKGAVIQEGCEIDLSQHVTAGILRKPLHEAG